MTCLTEKNKNVWLVGFSKEPQPSWTTINEPATGEHDLGGETVLSGGRPNIHERLSINQKTPRECLEILFSLSSKSDRMNAFVNSAA